MTRNLNEARILIADDEFSIRDILSQRLTEKGYKCTAVSNGSSALRKLDAHEFDLVLLDIIMPGKSGTDVLREIQARYPDTAVIMITAIADVETAIELMKMGAYDYIIKPIDLTMLTTSIDKALDKRRLILENRSYQLHLEERVAEQTQRIRESFLNSIKSLAYALEAKDKYTSGHSQKVAEVAVAIALELGMPEDKVEKIKLAGLLHDIGKIGISESVLNKPGKLTDEEYKSMRSHSKIGERILRPVVADGEILEMVRHHHERYDGAGYPDGLPGEEIPQGARILAVADAYDAMIRERPYRKAMSFEKACAEIERCSGRQFAPEVADAFLKTRISSFCGLMSAYMRPERAEMNE